MDAKDSGGRAFPRSPANVKRADGKLYFYDGSYGMTLRDYFAAKAIQSINWNKFDGGLPEASRAAYLFADAMLKARDQA